MQTALGLLCAFSVRIDVESFHDPIHGVPTMKGPGQSIQDPELCAQARTTAQDYASQPALTDQDGI
jgi:hypothetical protein